MSRHVASLGIAALFIVAIAELGCSTESHPATVSCGTGGSYVSDPLGRYCVYVVIETGFLCPSELPIRIEFDSHLVCTDHMGTPEDLPRDVCDRLPSGRCGRGDGGVAPTDGGSIADRLARMVELCHEWGDIVCAAQQACCTVDERSDASEADCRMRYYLGCDVTHHGVAYDDGRITLDVAAEEAFVARMRTLAAACDPNATGAGSGGIVGTTPLGGDCTPLALGFGVGRDASALWSCVPGLVCHVTMDATGLHGVCQEHALSGGSCGATINECDTDAGLWCDGGPRVCAPAQPDGAACNNDYHECAGGYCDHNVCTSTPHPRWCNM